MPLSDREQPILDEIEAQLYATDPDLVEQVSRTTLSRHARRNIGWAVVGFIAGFALLVVSFTSSVWLGLAGFGVMMGSASVMVRDARMLGRASFESRVSGNPGAAIRDRFGNAGKRFRGRFRHDED